MSVTLVVLGVLTALVASAVVYGVSWFASCGPAIIGYAEPEPPEIETLQFTLGGYVLAAVLAALGPTVGLVRSVRRNATVGIVVSAVLLLGVAVLFVPPIHDVTRALLAGRPGDYCIQPGYTGG